jgi:LysM repeat protein
MVASRRVHKETRIQPHLQTTTPVNSKKNLGANIMKSGLSSRTARYFFDGFLLLIAIILPISVQAGVFQSLLEVGTIEYVAAETPVTDSLVDVGVLAAAVNPDPQTARGGADIFIEDGVLVSTGPVGPNDISASKNNGGEISVYVVREGDSLSQIAQMFGVTSNTILWANDLAKASAIKPGDSLIILPIAGVRHVVKKGDTVSSIAKKYEGNAEEILSYNQLVSASDIVVGDTLVIPGGALHAEPAKVAAKPKKGSTVKTTVTAGSGFSHPIPGAIKTQGIHGYNAVDWGAGIGTTVRAASAGTVLVAKSSGWNGGYGNYIVVKHANGVQTLYAHLSRLDVGVGATVAAGESIGASGNSGKSTGPHLHFEVRGGRNPF